MPFENPYLYNNPFNAQQTPVYMPSPSADQTLPVSPVQQINPESRTADPSALTSADVQGLKQLIQQSIQRQSPGAITNPGQIANTMNPLNNTRTQTALGAAQAGFATRSPGYGALAGAGQVGLKLLFNYIHNKYGSPFIKPDPNYATQSTANGSTPISNGATDQNAGYVLSRDPSGLILRTPETEETDNGSISNISDSGTQFGDLGFEEGE